MLLYKQWRFLTLKILLQLLRGFLLYLLWRYEGCLWSVYWGLFNSPEQYMVNLKKTVYNCCTSKSIQETNGNYFCQEMKEVKCTCCQAICQWTFQALSHVSVYMNVHTNEMPLGHHVSSCSRIFTMNEVSKCCHMSSCASIFTCMHFATAVKYWCLHVFTHEVSEHG